MFVTCILQVDTARIFILDQLKVGLAKFENWNTESIDHSYLGSINNGFCMLRIASIWSSGNARFGLCDWAGCAAKRANT